MTERARIRFGESYFMTRFVINSISTDPKIGVFDADRMIAPHGPRTDEECEVRWHENNPEQKKKQNYLHSITSQEVPWKAGWIFFFPCPQPADLNIAENFFFLHILKRTAAFFFSLFLW